MKKSYIQIDEHYSQVVSKLPYEDKVEYLENIIDKNHSIISNSGDLISKLRRLEVSETIEAAQLEIKRLAEEKVEERKSSEG